MRYPHILAAIRSAKWAVHPATLHAIRDLLSSRLMLDRSALADQPAAVFAPRGVALVAAPGAGQPARVAVVPVFGVIGKRLDEFETMCGGCDLEHVEAALEIAVNDPRCDAVIMHFDSPGGVVTGVPELAAKIRAWNQQKKIYAFTDKLMASAAYWLASACEGIACTPTADVGSIGVYMAALDESEAWAKEGYKLVLVKSGTRKAEGIAGSKISDDTIAAWQAECDEVYAMFTTDVKASREQVTSEVMQGQCFMGAAAHAAQLVDDVLPDLDAFAAVVADSV